MMLVRRDDDTADVHCVLQQNVAAHGVLLGLVLDRIASGARAIFLQRLKDLSKSNGDPTELRLDACGQHIARNDRHRTCHGENFAMLTVPQLPPQNWSPEVTDTVTLIDAIWLKPGAGQIVSALEIEKTTSIYSGILQLEDLARSIPNGPCPLYLVAPNDREREVMGQLARAAFRSNIENIALAFLPFTDLAASTRRREG